LTKEGYEDNGNTPDPPQDKANLNKATNELKILLNNYKQQAIQTYLESLYPTEATDYSLWKATKWLQLPQTPIPPLRTPGGEWAKSDEQKVNTLADHSAQVFQPHTPDQTGGDKQDMLHALENNKLPASPIKNFTATEVRAAINHLHTTKAPGYDLITGEILKKLPEVGILAITYIFNSILRTGYFPGQWKVSQIVTILKPGKPAEDVKSYRPISLLPILSKIFEKLFITRIQPILQSTQIIPDHQFGFTCKHATIEQVHRITNIIHRTLENKQYCTAAFLDISQAFDKVWHEGLLYKLKTFLPDNKYNMNRHFRTK